MKNSRKIRAGIAAAVFCVGLTAASIPANATGGIEVLLDISDHHVEAEASLSDQLFVVGSDGVQHPARLVDEKTVAYRPDQVGSCSWYNLSLPIFGGWQTSVDGCSTVSHGNRNMLTSGVGAAGRSPL